MSNKPRTMPIGCEVASLGWVLGTGLIWRNSMARIIADRLRAYDGAAMSGYAEIAVTEQPARAREESEVIAMAPDEETDVVNRYYERRVRDLEDIAMAPDEETDVKSPEDETPREEEKKKDEEKKPEAP